MIYAENLMKYPDWTIMSTAQTDASDKKLCYFISNDNKTILLFSRRSRNSQRNYTM